MTKYIWITILVIVVILILGIKQAPNEPAVVFPDDTDDQIDAQEPAEAIVSESGNVKVFEPQANAKVGSPLLVRGEARVFENTIQFRLKDNQGNEITQKFVTYESDEVGEFGSFGELLIFKDIDADEGVLEVYSISAEDGSEINKVEIPVKFE